MKPWQILFKQAPKRDNDTQGASTGDDDFANEEADDALAEEGEAELEEEGDGEDLDEDPDEEQSEEDEDPEEDDDEDGVEEQEEEAPAAFKFKNESGDFDFKRINKAVGGDALEKAFKEQNATITRNFQELKSYKEVGSPQETITFRNKGKFLDDLIDNNPVVQAEVVRILNGGQPTAGGGRNPQPARHEIQGADPNDPLLPELLELRQGFQAINNRFLMEERRKQQAEQDQRFSQGVESGKAAFKELTGKNMTAEQAAIIEQEIKSTGYLNGANLVPGLFGKEIREAMSRKVISKRVAKKNLPRSGSGRRPSPGLAKKRSKEEERNDLWDKNMGDGFDD